ncbi:hypothetical protein GCM10023068_09180 [Leifsonia shinshuensis]
MTYASTGQLTQATIVHGSIISDEIAPLANNTLTNASCRVDKRTMQTLIAIIRFTGSVRVTDLNRHCANDGQYTCPSSSPHCVLSLDSDGLMSSTAMDIDATGHGKVDGYNNTATSNLRNLMKALVPRVNAAGFSPSGANMGQNNCSTVNLDSPYFNAFNDSCNHQHADFRGNSRSLNVPTSESSPSVVNVRAGGSVWGKSGLNTDWVQLTDDGEYVAVATSPGSGHPLFGALSATGALKAKTGLNGTWMNLWPSGVRSFAMDSYSDNGVLVAAVMEDGTLKAKEGLNTDWVPLEHNVQQVAVAIDPVNGPHIIALFNDGTVRVKTNLRTDWVTAFFPTPAAAVTVASDTAHGPTFAVINTAGTAFAKTGINERWINIEDAVTQLAVTSDTANGPSLAVLRTGGELKAKTGINTNWIQLDTAITSMGLANGQTVLANKAGTLRAKTGYNTNWFTLDTTTKTASVGR